MLYLIFCTVLVIFMGYLKTEFISSLLITYALNLITHFKSDKLEKICKAIMCLTIILSRDFYSFLIFIMALKIEKLDILLFILPLFFFTFSLERILIIVLFILISIAFKELLELKSKFYNSLIDKDRENLIQRLRKKEEIERRYLEEEKIKYEERKNLLGTLHHLIGHTITASILELKAIEIKSGMNDIKSVRNHLEDGLKEIRKTLHTIRDENIDFNKEAEIIKEDLEKNKINFKYKVDETSLDMNTKRELLNILKEGITNILRHSNSKNVSLSIVEEKGFYRYKLYNDDFPGGEIKKGLGLESMSRFSEARNGYFGINIDDGFEIVITIPKKGGENAGYSGWWWQNCCK